MSKLFCVQRDGDIQAVHLKRRKLLTLGRQGAGTLHSRQPASLIVGIEFQDYPERPVLHSLH